MLLQVAHPFFFVHNMPVVSSEGLTGDQSFRETPTSAGPNSFNKGKQGFSDNQKLWERKLKAAADKL